MRSSRQTQAQSRAEGGGGWPLLVIGTTWAALLASPWSSQAYHWRTVLGWGGLSLLPWLIGHWGLTRLRYRGDTQLWAMAGSLIGLGVLVQIRLGAFERTSWHQPYLWSYLLAPLVFLGAAMLRRGGLRWLQRHHLLAALGAVSIMYWLVFRGGESFRGARFGPWLTTPSEVLKVLLIVYLAGYLARRLDRGFYGVLGARLVGEGFLFVALWSVPQVMFVAQRDLGVVVLFGICLIVMFYVATGQPGYLFGGAAATGFGIAVLADLFPHIQRRWQAWLDPWQDPRGGGWQVIQGLFSLRAGWLDGVGLGAGCPHVVPLVSSDFVYGCLGEELGLWGCVMVVGVYASLVWRGWQIAQAAEDPFGRLLAVGCTTLLAVQVVVNMGGVLRLLPVTGITLPFVSRGGSSLLVSAAMLGLVATMAEGERRPGTRRSAMPGGDRELEKE